MVLLDSVTRANTYNFLENAKYYYYFNNIFSDSKITADGDCSHEIKRHLLLGKKAVSNLNSTLKSRDITLLTKVHRVKAMVFPVVMYRCDSWTIKKAEQWKNWCFRTVMLEKTFESPLDYKEISPEYSLEGLCWSWNSNSLVNWWEKLTLWKISWCWERLRAGGEGDDTG